jgi:outer membrane translocation and assembly module TamA
MPILNPLKNKIFLEVFYQRLKLNNKFNHDLSFSFNYSLLLEGIKLTTSLKFLFPNIDFKNNIFNEITPFIEIRVSNKDSDNQYFADESINFSVMYRNTLGFIPINLKFSQIKIDTNFIKTMGKLRIVSKNTLGILVTDSIDVFPTSLSFFPDDRQFRLYSESQIGPGKFIYNFALNFQFNFYSDVYTITGFEIGDITNNSRVPKFIINVGVMYKTPIGQASISYAFPIFNSFFQDKDNKAKVLSGKVLLSIGAEF